MPEQLYTRLDEIATYLAEGESWHRRTANELRKMPNKRGYARVHDDEAKCDAEFRICLDKILRDNMKYEPVIDTDMIAKAEKFTINGLDGFKQHFRVWVDREKLFLQSITAAIDLVRSEDIKVYHKLCALSQEVKEESIRAEWIWTSLEDTAWNPHHMAVVSKWLHEQAEANPGSMDFNIG